MIHAIDPGPVRSACVSLDGDRVVAVTLPNDAMLEYLTTLDHRAQLVIEMIASYGMAVGAEVFETCVWIGRFMERWRAEIGVIPARVKRIEVKQAICHDSRAKDANIRAALIDLFGGPDATKKGGPLYRVKADEWAALAVAVTAQGRK